MKKFLALVLALVMVLSMATNAFATTISQGSENIDVQARYEDQTETPDVYSVDISWGPMQFTYTKTGNMVWDPQWHTYNDETTGSWSGEGNSVRVVNHSNTGVSVWLGFETMEGFESVTGYFEDTYYYLDAGVVDGYYEADEMTSTLYLDGSLENSIDYFTKVGTITVSIS